MKFNCLDTSDELLVEVCKGGVRLARPEEITPCNINAGSVQTFLTKQFNIYFLDTGSGAQRLNDQTLIACGWDSNQDILTKSVIDMWSDTETLRAVIANDKEVLSQEEIRIVEEEVICSEGISHHALSYKFPWYDRQNKLIGLLGCTLVIGMDGYASLPEFLTTLTHSGLLNTSATNKSHTDPPGQMIKGIYFSKREKEVIFHLLHGNTAKRIALILGISYRTVERHLENIRLKTGAHNKAELVELMMRYFNINIAMN